MVHDRRSPTLKDFGLQLHLGLRRRQSPGRSSQGLQPVGVDRPPREVHPIEGRQVAVMCAERTLSPYDGVSFVPDQRLSIQQQASRPTEQLRGVDVVPAALSDNVRPKPPSMRQPPRRFHHEDVCAVDQRARIPFGPRLEVGPGKQVGRPVPLLNALDSRRREDDVGVREPEISRAALDGCFCQPGEQFADHRLPHARPARHAVGVLLQYEQRLEAVKLLQVAPIGKLQIDRWHRTQIAKHGHGSDLPARGVPSGGVNVRAEKDAGRHVDPISTLPDRSRARRWRRMVAG